MGTTLRRLVLVLLGVVSLAGTPERTESAIITDTLENVIGLGSTGVTVGIFQLRDFAYLGISPIRASAVTVTISDTDLLGWIVYPEALARGPFLSIKFEANWDLAANESMDFSILYTLSGLPGLYADHFSGRVLDASLPNTATLHFRGGTYEYATFDGPTTFGLAVGDISDGPAAFGIEAETGIGGSLTIPRLQQLFLKQDEGSGTVPEPASLFNWGGLVLAGLVSVYRRRNCLKRARTSNEVRAS